MSAFLRSLGAALDRCKVFAASIFLTYCISCLIGILMTHTGNEFALSQRDKIVGAAVKSDKASLNYQYGNNFTAVLYDCAGNLLYAAMPQTLMGFGVVLPYFTVTYQGWIGGIVSVDDSHHTRFRNAKSSAYYLIVLLLQFLPFSLSIGAGIKCGVDLYRHNSSVGWRLWKYRFPGASLWDLGFVYLVSVPLFFLASCFEFFSTWNI
jgi:hypothetical protein